MLVGTNLQKKNISKSCGNIRSRRLKNQKHLNELLESSGTCKVVSLKIGSK